MRRPRSVRRWLLRAAEASALLGILGLAVLSWQTLVHLRPVPETLTPWLGGDRQQRFTDRFGVPLSPTREERWNVHDRVSYHRLPELLRLAFVDAEDKRFFRHRGVDWLARGHALVQNLRAGRAVRGASTISEQVIRILHPRPRTPWSRWLEGFEATALERRYSKAEILEFYLNQVPYARQLRGVKQAARTYFDRDLATLSSREMLALAVLVRSPSRLDLIAGTVEIRRPLEQLARRMRDYGHLSADEYASLLRDSLRVIRARPRVDAAHFLGFVRGRIGEDGAAAAARLVRTTLDASLQERVRRLLDQSLADLARRRVRDGAVLVVDHRADEILAWVNAGGFSEREGGQIDKVTMPRQPGSTLKPLVYALALEKGWTAATLIEDAPLADAVGHGLHRYRNYSRLFYGPLRLREALGNSLNTPAVRAVRFTGRATLLERLRRAGFTTLDRHPDFYGDGLALGSGEVTLYALVGAYAALARGGELRPVRWGLDSPQRPADERRIFAPEASSIITDILSDPGARQREFGRHSVLDLPHPTAVKTGTSNDYRDAWTVGYSERYTVGVWMGNVDRQAMLEVTGSLGPALVLRSVFTELERHQETRPLRLDRRLRRQEVCSVSGQRPRSDCPVVSEWFRRGKVPGEVCRLHGRSAEAAARPGTHGAVRLASPVPGLHLALDPRIPDSLEVFELRVQAAGAVRRIDWWVDDRLVVSDTSGARSYPWPLIRGHHTARARVWLEAGDPTETQTVGFVVK